MNLQNEWLLKIKKAIKNNIIVFIFIYNNKYYMTQYNGKTWSYPCEIELL